jgi:hypothetical protein
MKNQEAFFFVSWMVQEYCTVYFADVNLQDDFHYMRGASEDFAVACALTNSLESSEGEEVSDENKSALQALLEREGIQSAFGEGFAYAGLKALLNGEVFVEPGREQGEGFYGPIIHPYWEHKDWMEERKKHR